MMNLKRCDNGHYYDGDKYQECPHCKVTESSDTVTVPTGDFPGADDTVPVNSFAGTEPLDEEDDKTIHLEYRDYPVQPVVGWLVCVEGAMRGNSFVLRSGKNFVGRNQNNDVILSDDRAVSRDKHAIVIYDPHSNCFLVQAGEARELFYLNDVLVLSAEKLKPYDIITLGGTKLLFIPLCGEKFTWEKNNQTLCDAGNSL